MTDQPYDVPRTDLPLAGRYRDVQSDVPAEPPMPDFDAVQDRLVESYRLFVAEFGLLPSTYDLTLWQDGDFMIEVYSTLATSPIHRLRVLYHGPSDSYVREEFTTRSTPPKYSLDSEVVPADDLDP